MDKNTKKVLEAVDEILLDYIERLEQAEGSGLYHGRAVALAVHSILLREKKSEVDN